MVRKFEVGGVYNAFQHGPVKVTHISAETVWCQLGCSAQLHAKIQREYDDVFPDEQAFLPSMVLRTHSCYSMRARSILTASIHVTIDAGELHCLHPWFPSGHSLCKAYLREYRHLPEWLCHFHKDIMKTFVLFFFSVKLIVIARRVKERMYAPGGIGFIAAQEDFDRATKSQRIE